MSNTRPNIEFLFRITNDVLWNTFKKNEVGDVMIPFIVLRRLDCMLEATKEKVRKAFLDFKDKVPAEKLPPVLNKASGQNYYNTSQYDLRALTDDPINIEINFRAYLNGFSSNVTDILENFQLDKIVARLIKNKLLYQMVEAIAQEDFHEDKVDNFEMGQIFEKVIQISNEQSNETAGEHFTPRDVIDLMVNLLFSTEEKELKKKGIIRTIYDLACGTGGMLTLSKKYILEKINPKATINIYGQEINEQSYAIAKSDLLITGEDPENIRHGNSFSEDRFPDRKFHYMMANPPYGVSWKKDQNFIKNEATNPAGRFYAGLPRTSDGQFLFLQHMIHKMNPDGSRIAMVSNGSPLFTGDAGSGESDIRKWIIENDYLDCLVALPNQLFFNTGINTYIWIVTNKKAKARKGKVQLINATSFAKPMKRSLNNKRNEVDQIEKICKLYLDFKETESSKIYDNDFFGYSQITVERPLLDDKGNIVVDKKGKPKPNGKLRDKENIPLTQDIQEYFDKEVLPHVPDAWIDEAKTKVGYEINFSKYFYKYVAPDPSGEIKVDIDKIEASINQLMSELFA